MFNDWSLEFLFWAIGKFKMQQEDADTMCHNFWKSLRTLRGHAIKYKRMFPVQQFNLSENCQDIRLEKSFAAVHGFETREHSHEHDAYMCK